MPLNRSRLETARRIKAFRQASSGSLVAAADRVLPGDPLSQVAALLHEAVKYRMFLGYGPMKKAAREGEDDMYRRAAAAEDHLEKELPL